MKPFVSTIIPFKNEELFIEECLRSVLRSDYPRDRLEVLVVDGMSTDGSAQKADRFAQSDPRVSLLSNPGRTVPKALNLALREAKGELILRLDAHSQISADYISRAVEHLEVSGADCAGGTMTTVVRTRGCLSLAFQTALTHPFGVGNSHFRIGSREPRWVDTVFGPCWRREVFERLGTFNEELERGQDMEFSRRITRSGGKILLVPGIEIRYYARSRPREFLAHKFTDGVWAILPFAYSDGIPVRARHLAPLALVVAVVASAAAGMFWPVCFRVAHLPLLAYGVVNLLASAHAAVREKNWRMAVLLPWVFAATHLSYGSGSMWGAARLAWGYCAGNRPSSSKLADGAMENHGSDSPRGGDPCGDGGKR